MDLDLRVGSWQLRKKFDRHNPMSNEPSIQVPDSPPDEPTVLDLYKSVFKDWKAFFNFVASIFIEARRGQINRSLAEVQDVSVEPAEEPVVVTPQHPTDAPLPWLAISGFMLAFLAQYMLEPSGQLLALGPVHLEKSGRNLPIALGIYALALGLIVWSIIRGQIQAPAMQTDDPRYDPETVKLAPLTLSVILAIVAFASFGGNLFTFFNVGIWLLSIALFAYALWLPYRRQHRKLSIDERRRAVLWTLLLIYVAGVVIFFRVYRVDTVPPEPFSDHAEKILDVFDVSTGQTHIFFIRNTGREALQMYWTLLVSWIFNTGLTFLSLKIGTVLLGVLTLPYIYLLGREIGGARVGLFALFFAGIGYWPNVISRVGLRFPLYPLFVAPTLFYLFRGLRTRNRNDFIVSGLFLGLGLHGYSPVRILPIVVVVAIGIYLLHVRSTLLRRDAVLWLVILAMASLLVFLPLMRYSLENPGIFSYRALTRLGNIERPLPEPAIQIFFSNLWKGMGMFNWENGDVWVVSVANRPALDVVTGALFLIGVVLVLGRYLRNRHWLDLFLILSIPLLALPSILSLAFPGENPSLNRAGGAYVPVFILVAIALESLVSAIGRGKMRAGFASGMVVLLVVLSGLQSYDLVFRQYYQSFRFQAWNTTDMGVVIKQFEQTYGETDTIWIVPYPHWVDTRLPGIWAGIPNRDFAMWRDNLPETLRYPGPKLFMVKANLESPESNDQETLDILRELYPQGSLELHRSDLPGRDFWIYSVP